jgi:CPA1 family monovalent cation:H+ antiporter
MRGLVTLATAFALPADFPERDLLVLTAFAVVLATLVIQGATLAPMIHIFRLGRREQFHGEMDTARRSLAEAAVARLAPETGPEADSLRAVYSQNADEADNPSVVRRRELSIAATVAQRQRLEELRDADKIGPTQYLELQEDLDWQQLAAESEDDRRITES